MRGLTNLIPPPLPRPRQKNIEQASDLPKQYRKAGREQKIKHADVPGEKVIKLQN